MDTMTKVKVGVGVVAVVGVAYLGYKIYKGIGGVVSNFGTGKNVTGAAEAAWNIRPKIIFKGTDNAIIGGLFQ